MLMSSKSGGVFVIEIEGQTLRKKPIMNLTTWSNAVIKAMQFDFQGALWLADNLGRVHRVKRDINSLFGAGNTYDASMGLPCHSKGWNTIECSEG